MPSHDRKADKAIRAHSRNPSVAGHGTRNIYLIVF